MDRSAPAMPRQRLAREILKKRTFSGLLRADEARRDLIGLFKADLDIPPDAEDGHGSRQAEVSD